MKFNEFLNECKEKDVFKSLSIYVVSSWVLLQVVSLLAEPLNLPKATLTVLLLLLLVGFPVYTFFIWQFRIKPAHSLKSEIEAQEFDAANASSKSGIEIDVHQDKVSANSQSLRRFQKMYFIGVGVIGVLSLLSVIFIVKTNYFKDDVNTIDLSGLVTEGVSDKIAVLKFDNNTGKEDFEVIGKMAVDWIMHGITENKIAQVISPKIIDDYSKILKASMLPDVKNVVVTDYLKPSKVINGSFYLNNNNLMFQSSITDSKMDKTLVTFPTIECDSKSPLDCIESLNQRILGYLETEDNPLESWEESPPKYEAYKSLIDANTNYGNGDGEYLRLVKEAIKLDSTFFEPKIDLLEYYYNNGQYDTSDSLISSLSTVVSSNKRQSNLLKMYRALLAGDNGDTYKYLNNEYKIYPFDIDTNTSFMIIALQFVNRPQDVNAIFSEVSMTGIDLEDCGGCRYRLYIKALSDIELGNHQAAIDLLEPSMRNKENLRLKEALLRAYIRTGQTEKTLKLISDAKLFMSIADWRRLSFLAAMDYQLKSQKDKAKSHLEAIVNSFEEKDDLTGGKLKVLGRAYFYLNDYVNAERYLKKYLLTKPQNRLYDHLSALAICYEKLGNKSAANQILKELDANRDDYSYGHIDYAYAQYYAATSQDKKALESLYKAVSDGKWYTPDGFHNDVLLQSLVNTEDFKRILTFWH